MSERLLIIAAHPDDETLGCGGTIARHTAAGDPVRVVFLAEGVTARYDPKDFNTPLVVEQSKRRNMNAIKALGILGVPKNAIHLNTRPCCRLDQVPQIDLVKQIEQHINDFSPTALYTHWPHDTNVDHRLAFKSTLTAVRPLDGKAPKRVCSFEAPSSTEWNPTIPFHANVFHDISDYINLKIDALRAYDDEMRPAPHPRSEEVVRALATYRGSQVGVSQAEGFNLIRSLVK